MGDGLVQTLGANTSRTHIKSLDRFFRNVNYASLVSRGTAALSGYGIPEVLINHHVNEGYQHIKAGFEKASRLVRSASVQIADYRNLLHYEAMSLLDWLAPATELTYSQLLENLEGYLMEKHPEESFMITSKAVFSGNVVIELNPEKRTAKIVSEKHSHLADIVKKAGFRIA